MPSYQFLLLNSPSGPSDHAARVIVPKYTSGSHIPAPSCIVKPVISHCDRKDFDDLTTLLCSFLLFLSQFHTLVTRITQKLYSTFCLPSVVPLPEMPSLFVSIGIFKGHLHQEAFWNSPEVLSLSFVLTRLLVPGAQNKPHAPSDTEGHSERSHLLH